MSSTTTTPIAIRIATIATINPVLLPEGGALLGTVGAVLLVHFAPSQ